MGRGQTTGPFAVIILMPLDSELFAPDQRRTLHDLLAS